MNPETLNQLIVEGLRLHDPNYFGNKCHPAKRRPRDRTLGLLGQVVDEICRATPDAPTVTILFQVRGVLAPMAQKLRWAMDVVFERSAKTPLSGQAVENLVTKMVMRELDRAFGSEIPAALHVLTAQIVREEAARLPKGFDIIKLGQMSRVALAHIGLSLHRASACIWTMALQMGSAAAGTNSKPEKAAATKSIKKTATPDEVAAYLKALTGFAATLAALNVDPATLPVGETAVEEAEALCAVRYFIQQRFFELRRWVVPQAAVDPTWTSYAEISADLGEQLILQYHDDGDRGDANEPQIWTWRGQDCEEYIIGDMLCALQHAAEALGIDWDSAVGAGEWHHANDLKEDVPATR